MKCPYCNNSDDKVVDSRTSRDAAVIRRRRECLNCGQRYTTYERVESVDTYVIKKDGSREVYDRAKLKGGILKAIQKRPVSIAKVDEFLDSLETNFQENNLRELPAKELGEVVMNWLKNEDDVAYVRFASVYREFRDVQAFMRELEIIIGSRLDKTSA